MGEEDPSQRPFVFFAQHDEGLAQSIREGRRREFERMFPPIKSHFL
jgi:1,4-alpha-glucan branching enzyme